MSRRNDKQEIEPLPKHQKLLAAINFWWILGILIAGALIIRTTAELAQPPDHIHQVGQPQTSAVGTAIGKKGHREEAR